MFPKLLVFLVLFAWTSLIFAQDHIYYVQGHSAGDPGDGSAGRPFRTIQQGLDIARAGDTVRVDSGTYFEHLQFPVSGSPSRPIRLIGNGQAEVIDPTGAESGVTIEDRSYISIREMNFRNHANSREALVLIRGAGSNIEIERCRFDNRRNRAAIAIEGTRGEPIRGIVVKQCSIDLQRDALAGISVNGNVDGFIIQGNIIARGSTGIEVIGGLGICPQPTLDAPRAGNILLNSIVGLLFEVVEDSFGIVIDGGRDIKVSRNRLSAYTTGTAAFANAPGCVTKNVTFRSNLIRVAKRTGLRIGNRAGQGRIEKCSALSNRLVDNGGTQSRLGQISVMRASDVAILGNNILRKRKPLPFVSFLAAPRLRCNNNDYMFTGSPEENRFFWNGRKYHSLRAFQEASRQDQNSQLTRQ